MRQCKNVWSGHTTSTFYPSCLLSSEYQDPIWEWTKVCNSITIVVAWSLASSYQTTEPHPYTPPLTNTHVRNKADEAARSHSLETVRVPPAHADQRALVQEPRCAPTHGVNTTIPCLNRMGFETLRASFVNFGMIARADAVQLARLPGLCPPTRARRCARASPLSPR
ncbi:hypothetical protein EDB84DRAFT_175309 [Lactarius hengduanensis]|nr:hypothetical protein EDB84DRAFT_175309 [Lactarius hengduanensis]